MFPYLKRLANKYPEYPTRFNKDTLTKDGEPCISPSATTPKALVAPRGVIFLLTESPQGD